MKIFNPCFLSTDLKPNRTFIIENHWRTQGFSLFFKSIRTLLILLMFVVFGYYASANGVVISNVAINGQNTSSQYSLVNLEITRNNSWRNTTTTNNWDACLQFLKCCTQAGSLIDYVMITWYDFNITTNQTLPTAYPNRFDTLYCLKYFITNEKNTAFFNTLTRTKHNTGAKSTLQKELQ